ncbi:MAG: efflux RND transporter periplasmic adaptor subunit [Sedimentisphaerales bacterium]|nr:efflux RND transporter periplasmic adaptor subunit [Sedimentisphaerales bacterium]
MNRLNRFLLAATTLALLFGSLSLTGCEGKTDGKEAQVPKKVPTVAVEAVRREPIARLLDLTGETVAVESVVISATVEGPIGYCPWREGDSIEQAGQKLIEIHRDPYRAEVHAAEAAVEVARAKLADLQAGTRPEEIAKARESVRQLEDAAAFAKADYDRTAKLVESGSLPGEALEKSRVEHTGQQARLATAGRHLEMLEAGYTRTAIAVQEATVKESSAKLDLAKARLGECVVSAPFAGTITRVHVRAGDMAAVKAPLLEMADLSSLVIRIAVPEVHASAVHEGMIARVTLDSFSGRTFAARVARAYPELDRRMRTRTVELVLDEPAKLMPGMFARVRLVLESVEDALAVSQQAVIVTPAGGQVAYVVADGKAVQRKVKVGIEQAGRVQVLAGLEPGEKVVVTGQEKLKDGMEVRIPTPGGTPNKPGPGTGSPMGKKGGNR